MSLRGGATAVDRGEARIVRVAGQRGDRIGLELEREARRRIADDANPDVVPPFLFLQFSRQGHGGLACVLGRIGVQFHCHCRGRAHSLPVRWRRRIRIRHRRRRQNGGEARSLDGGPDRPPLSLSV